MVSRRFATPIAVKDSIMGLVSCLDAMAVDMIGFGFSLSMVTQGGLPVVSVGKRAQGLTIS